MGFREAVETGRDRKELVADAGFSRMSFASAAAGVLTAYGAFAVLAGIAAGVLSASDVDIDLAAGWSDLTTGGVVVVAGLLFVAYLFGGYVAGRMARRAGALHGAVVFVLGLVVVAVAAVVAGGVGGADAASANLRDLGVPTTGSEWAHVASITGIVSLAAMLLGALAGGTLGERWHTKLLARALDPNVGAEAEARETAARLAAEAEERRTESVERVRTTAPTATVPLETPAADPDPASDGDADAMPPRERAYAMHPATRSRQEAGIDGGNGERNFWWRLEPEPAGSRSGSPTDRS